MPSLILALALAVAPLTASRQDESYGPTDLFLLLAVVVAVAAALNRLFAQGSIVAETLPGRNGAEALRPTLIYSAVALFLLCISTMANWNAVARLESPVIALAGYVVSFAIVIALYLEAAGSGLRRIMLGYAAFSLVLLAVYFAGWAANYEPFFFYNRFVGLSENPNQTALHMVCVIVVSIAALGKLPSVTGPWRLILGANIVLATALGLLSRSDAFTIALVAMFAIGLVHWLVLRATQSAAAFGTVVFVLAPLALVTLLLTIDDLRAVPQFALEQMEVGNQDSDRLLLWINGLRAWQERWLIGNGPGGWSGFARPFEGHEAHNTFVDILTITGIAGLMAYLGLLATLFRRRLQTYLASYYCLLGLLTFSFFHFTLRHPIFWFAIVAIHMASLHRRADGETAERFVIPGMKPSRPPAGFAPPVSAAGTPAA